MSTPCLIVDLPGPVGPAGTNGTNGTNGENAYTTTTAIFLMPAEGVNVTVGVANSDWMVVGQKVAIGDPGGAAFGTFQVISKPGSTSVVLQNISVIANGIYPDNSVAGTPFPLGIGVSPAGLQGPAGATGGVGLFAGGSFIVQTPTPFGALPLEQPLAPLATGVMTVTTGTGVVGSIPVGTNSGEIPPVDAVALTMNDPVFCGAAGLQTLTPVNALGALGIVIGTANTNIPPVNDAAGLTNGEFLRATATGIESVTDAVVKAQLGLSGGVGAWAVFYYQANTGVDADAFTQSPVVNKVPFNQEILDPSNIASVATGTITLAAAGTYRIRWAVQGYAVDGFQTSLYNVNTTTDIANGTSAFAGSTDTTADTSIGQYRLTIGASTAIEIHAKCQTTGTFGKKNSIGQPEVYATIEIEKEL